MAERAATEARAAQAAASSATGARNGRRLKVLHIPGWYPSQKNPVAGVFVKEHVKASALHHDVVVLYSEGVDSRVRGLYRVEKSFEEGIRTLRLLYRKSPVPKTTYAIYLWAMFSAFRGLVREGFRPDVIHAHVYSAGVPAVLIGRRYRIPVVITEHFTGFPRGLVRGLERLKAKFAFERAALVCPVSEDLRGHIERLGIRARFRVVPNVVDTSLFFPPQDAVRARDGRKRLLTVALLDAKKGIPHLLEALAILRAKRSDFVLDIVGDGPQRAEYEELARRLGLQDFVRFHGLKPKPEVAEFMRRADLFVLPSEWENLPCVIIEAMASGLPVVATSVGGIPEMVNDDVGRLVPPKDAGALADAVANVLAYSGRYEAQRLASYAKRCFSYEAVGRALSDVYQNVEVAAERSAGGT